MAEDRALEAHLNACVAAGVAARRAAAMATALRVEEDDRALTVEEKKQLDRFDAESARLGKAFVAAQGLLSEATPTRFQQHMAEVNCRIPKSKPGDRVAIARGPGAQLAGTVYQPRPSDPVRDDIVCVQFDIEPASYIGPRPQGSITRPSRKSRHARAFGVRGRRGGRKPLKANLMRRRVSGPQKPFRQEVLRALARAFVSVSR
jgi:hypothetical protein